MKNANPKLNPITTTLGTLLVLISMLIWLAPMFVDVRKDYEEMWYIPTGILCVGVLFILAPDKLVTGIGKVIDKGGDKI